MSDAHRSWGATLSVAGLCLVAGWLIGRATGPSGPPPSETMVTPSSSQGAQAPPISSAPSESATGVPQPLVTHHDITKILGTTKLDRSLTAYIDTDVASEAITTLPVATEMQVLARRGDWTLMRWTGPDGQMMAGWVPFPWQEPIDPQCCAALLHQAQIVPPQQRGVYMAAAGACDGARGRGAGKAALPKILEILGGAPSPAACR